MVPILGHVGTQEEAYEPLRLRLAIFCRKTSPRITDDGKCSACFIGCMSAELDQVLRGIKEGARKHLGKAGMYSVCTSPPARGVFPFFHFFFPSFRQGKSQPNQGHCLPFKIAIHTERPMIYPTSGDRKVR